MLETEYEIAALQQRLQHQSTPKTEEGQKTTSPVQSFMFSPVRCGGEADRPRASDVPTKVVQALAQQAARLGAQEKRAGFIP